MRAAVKPLVADLREAAPRRSGKLSSSVKPFTTSDLGFGVRWGGKASAASIRRAEALGYDTSTPGRASEAYYAHAVAKGHALPSGRHVPANKWAYPVIARHYKRVEAELRRAADRLADRFNKRTRAR